ncbi:MAG: hypothetical protein ISR36_04135 [Gammaproteobacteria bacterium]|nr:hypothetical protein [Gammaproteobacteria bacterium]
MADFQSFRNAVLESVELQEAVVSRINTAIANGYGLGDSISMLTKSYGYNITAEEVYEHQGFLGEGEELTDFELELISGGQTGISADGNC